MNPTHEQLLAVAIDAVQAGAESLAAWKDRFKIRKKGPADLVTDADVASERAIRRVIHRAFPDHGFLGEEGTGADEKGQVTRGEAGRDVGPKAPQFRWIADPIDGTTNFAHKIPFYCVSLAVEQDGKSVVGAILDPNHNELFTAISGGGTQCNGELVSPRPCRQIGDAVLAISLPPRLSESRWELESLKRLVPGCRAFRRTGSAALNLCYVAAGRINGFWASSLNLWDRAAGELFVREAGGVVTDIDGGPLTGSSKDLLATSDSRLHEKILSELRTIRR